MELQFLIQLGVLLLAFEIKHYFADYPLQKPYMYENKGKKDGWIEPLYDHATVHARGTFIIVLAFLSYKTIGETNWLLYGIILFGLSAFDLITHFAIDRWKATKPYGPNTSEFWLYLGKDQGLHHIVGFIIILVLLGL